MKCWFNWSDLKWGINGIIFVFIWSKFVKGIFIWKWKLVEILWKDFEYWFVIIFIMKLCECIFKKKMRRLYKLLFKLEILLYYYYKKEIFWNEDLNYWCVVIVLLLNWGIKFVKI